MTLGPLAQLCRGSELHIEKRQTFFMTSDHLQERGVLVEDR